MIICEDEIIKTKINTSPSKNIHFLLYINNVSESIYLLTGRFISMFHSEWVGVNTDINETTNSCEYKIYH